MSENNSSKSPRTNTEVSPIRNLFRKNDTDDSISKQTENKSEPTNPKKPSDNKENTKASHDDKQKPTPESNTETQNKTESKTEIKSEQKQEIKPETKSEKIKKEEKTEKEIQNDTKDKDDKDNKTDTKNNDNVKPEKEPEQPKTLSEKEEPKPNENKQEEKNEKTDNSENTNKKSFFGKIKSKITDIVMSMKQPEEDPEPQIEDIFSSSGNFVREKNADPLDVDAEYRENVIYTAPKEEEKKPDESVVSVSDVVKAVGKNIKTEKPQDDKNDRDITEILNTERTEKNTEKPEKDKAEISKSEISKKSESQTQNAQKPQTVKPSDPKTDVVKSQTDDIKDKNAVQKSKQNNNQNITATQKTQPVKPQNNEITVKKDVSAKTIYQSDKSDKQLISENKAQSIKKPVYTSDTKTEEQTKATVENVKETNPKVVATQLTENKKISENKSVEQPKPTKSQIKNSESEKRTEHSDNTAKITHEPPKADTVKKQNPVTAQKLPKTDVSDKNKKDVTKTPEQLPQKNNTSNNTSKIDGDDGIKILPWTPKKDVPEPRLNQNTEKIKAPDTKGKDLSEGSSDILIYHYSKVEPFVVMAGKFTKTVKSEYEEVRKFNRTPLDDSASKKPKNITSPIVEEVVTKKPQQKSDVTPKTQNKKISEVKPIENNKKSVPEKPVVLPEIQKAIKSVQTENKPIKSMAQISEVKKPVSKDIDKPPVDDVKKTTEQNTAKQSSAKKIKKSQKTKKPKKNYNFRNIFSSEEEYDPEDVEKIPVNKPQLDDYTNEKDSETIKTEIAENFRHVFTRTCILFMTTLISVVVSIIAQCVPSLFNQTIRNGWLVYAIINFLLFSVSVVVSRVPIVNGIMPLRHFKGNSDTAIAVASFAVAIQSITALFSPSVFVNGTLYIYSSLVILALFFNSLGKLLIILRTYNNFRFLSKPRPKYAGKIYTDIRNAEKISSGLPSKKPIIAYTKKSNFMSNFLQLSYAPDPSEDAAAKIAPYAALLSIVCGILYGVMTRDFVGAVSSFALSACITIPVCSLLAVNIPLKRLCHNSIKGGAMVTSYETVKQFCDTNVVMVDSSQLYPPGTVRLSGIKAFKESKINDAITAGAAIMFAVNGTMSYIFENIIQDRKDILPKVESVIYEDGMGLVGWISGQRVLIGNRRLLESHNITPPEKSIEDKYLNIGNQVTYISMGGELVAMFILSYTADREIMHELRNLEDNGVSFAVRTVDPNITQENIAEKFCLFFRCIKILPTSLGTLCHNVTSSVDEKSRAYLVTRGKISSFARAVSGCIRIKSNITLSIIIQYIAIILGLLIVTLISFISGFEKLGCLEMLLYIGFWAVATIIIPLIKK